MTASPVTVVSPSLNRSVRTIAQSFVTGAVRSPELAIGLFAVVATGLFSWVPSLWYDEGATVTSATRTWAQLWSEIHSVDAVHAFYYALMHVWFTLVGYTPFTLRLPSVLAIGFSAALVVALGRRLGGLRVGIVAGIVFVLLPRVAWAAGEGRPYATITTLSAGLTLVGITAFRRAMTNRTATWWWVGYAALAVVACTFNVYLALLVAAHGVALTWTLIARYRAERRLRSDAAVPVVSVPLVSRRLVVRWITVAGAAGVLVLPVLLVVASQSRQVGWIGGVGWSTVGQVFATAWFGSSNGAATVGWALIVLAVVSCTRRVRAHRARTTPADARDVLRMQAVRIALPAVVMPTTILVGLTAAGAHLYSPKYASLSLPYVAIMVALGLTTIRPKVTLAVAVVALAALAVPTSVAVRLPHAKQDSHWADAAAIIERERAANPQANEGVVYGSVYKHPTTTTQIIRDSYPAAFVGLRDLAQVTSGAEQGVLWDTNGDLATTIPSRLADVDTVWFVGGTSRDIRPELTSTLDAEGFHVAEQWTTGTVVISEYVRGS